MPIVLQTDLTTAGHIAATLVDGQSQAYQAQAQDALRTTLELQNRQWRASVSVVDLSTQLIREAFVVTGPESGGLIDVLDGVAIRLDSRASVFSTRRDSALQRYSQAASAGDASARLPDLRAAVNADPGFGLAYLSAVDMLSQTDPDAASDWLQRASSQAQHFTALDRARLRTISNRLRHAPLNEQAEAAGALVGLAPNSLDALVSLSSLRFLQGQAAAGVQLLQKALQLSPGNVTVRSYLALGLVESHEFRQAESVFQSLGNDASVLPQLAVCVLLEGERARADAIFDRYLKIQENGGNATAPLIHANWLAISDRLPDAVTLIKGAQLPSPDLRSVALSQAAVWQLMSKDRAAAKADSAAALRIAGAAQVRGIASAANAISSGGALRQSVEAAPLTPQQKAIVLAYGLFLNEQYADASTAWRSILDESGGTDLRSRAMLAASLKRSGAGDRGASGAAPVQPFIPNVAAGDQYAAVAFSEMRRLLGR